jgi:hypothetical protein
VQKPRRLRGFAESQIIYYLPSLEDWQFTQYRANGKALILFFGIWQRQYSQVP